MACNHPLKAFKVGYHESGKPKYKIVSYTVHHCEQRGNVVIPCYENFFSPFCEKYYTDYVEIPCGKCLACRLKYSAEWADRMMLESLEHQSNYWLTLTYDDDHLPLNGYGVGTLKKKDFQDFMKRLRFHFSDQKLRFYACGEYGDHTFRPHYHAIIFGLQIDDLEFFGNSSDYPVFISETISNIWKNGHVLIGGVTFDSCAYTARYVVKKQKGQSKELYEQADLVPQFSLCSRRPGLARNYFDENYKSIYETDELIYSTIKGGVSHKPPRYFDKCLENIDERFYILVKETRRRVSESARSSLLKVSQLSYEEILIRREHALISRTKVLKRIL